MASFVKFQHFATDLAAGVHANALNTDTDTLKVYLSNTAPDVAADAVKADMAEISTGNGYSGPIDVQNAASTSSGTITVSGTDVVITASGAVGPFRYVVLFNDTPSSPADPLIGYWDYGSSVTLANGETFTVDLGSSLFTVA
jgi:hypothetical protein